jgi:hypothetical protein
MYAGLRALGEGLSQLVMRDQQAAVCEIEALSLADFFE